MLRLSKLIRKLEKRFEIHISKVASPNLEISNCMLIAKDTKLPRTFFPHCLYIFEEYPTTLSMKDNDSWHNFLIVKPLPTTIQNSADFIPMIECMKPICPHEAYTLVQSELYEHLSFLNKKEELMRTVQSNYGLDTLMKQAYKYLENPVYLCNFAYHVVSYYPPIANHELFLHTEQCYEQLKNDFCEPMTQMEFIEKVLSYPLPFFLPATNGHNRLLISAIRSRQSTISFLCVEEKATEFRAEDIEYVDMLGQIIAIELQKTYNPVSLSRNHQHEEFLLNLIKCEFDSSKTIDTRMNTLGIKLNYFKWVMVVRLPDQNRTNILWVCGQMKNILHQHIIAVYQESVVVLLHGNYLSPLTTDEQTLLTSFLATSQLQAAISNQFTDLSHAKDYYLQAVCLMKKLALWYPDQQIVTATECDLMLLLTLSSHLSPLRSYIHPDIKYLNYYDKQNNTNYLETIRTYLECNRNAMNTAKQLNIHKSTFFYRITKIKEFVDLSLEDSQKLLSYEISLRILDYLKQSETVIV